MTRTRTTTLYVRTACTYESNGCLHQPDGLHTLPHFATLSYGLKPVLFHPKEHNSFLVNDGTHLPWIRCENSLRPYHNLEALNAFNSFDPRGLGRFVEVQAW